MADAPENARQRDRSPAYPSIPLGTALERLVAFEAHFKRSTARPEKVGEAWGIKAKAYADRTVAALRYFGLIDYQGAGKDRGVVISDVGRKYLRAQQDEMKREVIKEAALRPRQINKLWNQWGADRPADAACLDELMFNNGFSEAGAREFLKVYDETISFAGLSKSDKDDGADTDGEKEKLITPPAREVEVGDLIQAEINGALVFPEPKRVRAIEEHDGGKWVFVEGEETGIPMEQAILEKKGEEKAAPPRLPLETPAPSANTRKEVFALDEGDVVLTFPDNLSSASFADLDAYMKVFLAKMRRRAGGQGEPESSK